MTEHKSQRLSGAVPANQGSSAPLGGDDADDLASSATPPVAGRARKPSVVREVAETLLIALVIFVAVRAIVLNFRVDGLSMNPSLKDNEMLLVNRNAYFSYDENSWFGWIPGVDSEEGDIVYPFGKPERGDIVVVDPPAAATADKPYIKRVIGLPGEHVTFNGNNVFIDGVQLNEPYIIEATGCGGSQICDAVVPDGHVWVLGDNRNNSSDSRTFGPVEMDAIVGKAWVANWPLEKFGVIPEADYDPPADRSSD